MYRQLERNLLNSNITSRCAHNMVNVGPLMAEIGSGVWGTPTNFNGFGILAALLHGSQVVSRASAKLCGVEQRAPPMFSRATITLGIGPHSSSLYFHAVVSIFSSSFFSLPNLSDRRLDVYHTSTWCGPSANLECRSEMCCTRLAENTGCKKSPSAHCRTTLSGYIFATKARIDNWKKLVKQQYLLHMPHNMMNFGTLAAEIVSLVWGTLPNFYIFVVLVGLILMSTVCACPL